MKKFNEYLRENAHIEWAQQRALKYLEQGNIRDAVMSMVSDLKKIGQDNPLLMPLAMSAMHSPEEAKKFIMGSSSTEPTKRPSWD